jgi:hypothetical protein
VGRNLLFFVYLFYCFEAGIFLLLIPWLRAWEDNWFLFRFEILQPILLSGFTRGAVSSLGLVHILLGLADSMDYFRDNRSPAE